MGFGIFLMQLGRDGLIHMPAALALVFGATVCAMVIGGLISYDSRKIQGGAVCCLIGILITVSKLMPHVKLACKWGNELLTRPTMSMK